MTSSEAEHAHSDAHTHSHGAHDAMQPNAASAEEPATPRKPKQEQEEASTEVTEVAPGILRTQLSVNLPGLGHVNCYVMEDERGIAIVDPGLPGEESWQQLKDRLGRAGFKVEDVHTVVITHSHFDHFGGAMRLRDEVGADILTHESFRAAWNKSDLEEHEDSSALDLNTPEGQEAEIERMFSQRQPWGTQRSRPPQEMLDRMAKMGRFSREWYATPEPSIAVTDGQTVRLARREWIAIHTPGHTYDHLCLFDPDSGAVFTGDHVLPTITPHISGMSPEVDPLANFFSSLQRMADLEGASIALPAHGHPFVDVGGRAVHIMEHHEERLDVIREASHQLPNGSVNEFMRVLFRERSWGDMAESETYAHLEHLRELGELAREDPDGMAHYAPTA